MFPDYKTLPVTIVAFIIGLAIMVWHKKIAEYFMGTRHGDVRFNPKLDEAFFITGIIIIAVCILWLLRIIGE